MTKYLLDSNIYINFYERYYQISHFPTFWANLPILLNQHVVIPKIVIAENFQNPWFKDWIDQNYRANLLNHKSYSKSWAKVITHVAQSPYYTSQSLQSQRGWANDNIADPWLIAISLADGYTLVTNELGNHNRNSSQPSTKTPKIPDICTDLNVRCIDMNTFFTEINLKI